MKEHVINQITELICVNLPECRKTEVKQDLNRVPERTLNLIIAKIRV